MYFRASFIGNENLEIGIRRHQDKEPDQTIVTMPQVPLIRLQCGVNSYDWGKKGHESAAAKYAAATPPSDFEVKHDQPYAEVNRLASFLNALFLT